MSNEIVYGVFVLLCLYGMWRCGDAHGYARRQLEEEHHKTDANPQPPSTTSSTKL